MAQKPKLRTVWLMVSALEGLLKQVSSNPSNITPSVLSTAAGAVDVLEILLVPDYGAGPNHLSPRSTLGRG